MRSTSPCRSFPRARKCCSLCPGKSRNSPFVAPPSWAYRLCRRVVGPSPQIFPPEQLAVKLLCPLGIVSGDFKPDDARRRAFSLAVFWLCLRLCTHSYLSVG